MVDIRPSLSGSAREEEMCIRDRLYQALLQEVLQFHSGNQRRIRKGMLSQLLVPLVFLVLLFLSEGSRVIFLLLWIVSMFGIAAYLIAVEYICLLYTSCRLLVRF